MRKCDNSMHEGGSFCVLERYDPCPLMSLRLARGFLFVAGTHHEPE